MTHTIIYDAGDRTVRPTPSKSDVCGTASNPSHDRLCDTISTPFSTHSDPITYPTKTNYKTIKATFSKTHQIIRRAKGLADYEIQHTCPIPAYRFAGQSLINFKKNATLLRSNTYFLCSMVYGLCGSFFQNRAATSRRSITSTRKIFDFSIFYHNNPLQTNNMTPGEQSFGFLKGVMG